MTRPLRHPLILPQLDRRGRSPFNSVATLALMVSGALLPASQAAGQIVADGNTATTVTPGAGGVTNITTGTISGNHGVNTFSSFSTPTGSVTNIHVPNGATGTVNIVNGPRSVIDGAVNSVRNGSIGGDLHFANPAGIVVGPDGGFHGGSVSLSTPSQDFVRQMIQPGGGVSAGHVQQLVGGHAPLGQGDIIINGHVRGQSGVSLRAGRDVIVGGQVRAQQGGRGGAAIVRAARDVRVHDGAVILAEGEGAGHGGTIDVFASNAAILELGGRVSVAAYGNGDGGFVEFSAEKAVEVHGLLQAWSEGGRGGTVFIDPEHLTISGEITSGANFRAEATASITVQGGAIISTRRVSEDASDAEHVTAESTGDSGSIELTAPNITIEALAQLLAFADNGYQGGDITLTAARIDRDGHLTQALPVSSTSILIERAYLRGQNITIRAETAKFNQVDAEDNINSYLSGLIPDGLPGGLTNTLVDLGEKAASRVQSTLDAANYDNWPSYLEARAEIGINRSTLHSDGSIRIASIASTETEITPATGGMALVIAASNTAARSVVTNSALVAEGDVSITSKTHADHKLRAEGVPGGGVSGLNTALVASVRMGGAETVLAGLPAGSAWTTQSFLPEGVSMNRNAVIQAGGDVTLGAVNYTDLSLQAESVLGENGRGAAIVLSLDDRSALTAAGGKIWSNRMALDVHARNVYRKVLIDARVTGGAMQAEDAPTTAVAGQPDAQQDVMASVLGGVAAQAEGGSGIGQSAGITATTQGGAVTDRAYAASFALANHNARAQVVLGDTNFVVTRPGGGTDTTRAFDLEPMGGFTSGTLIIPPTITRNFDAQQNAITILAENVLQDVRQRAIAAAGELPEPGSDPDPAAKRTGLVAISFADWDLDARVDLGSATASISSISAGGGITITARNVAPDFAEREKLADAHDLYSGKRQSEAPDDETGDTGNGDDDAPNQGGILGAWSDGEGPLFSRAGEDDDDPLALSFAQTFAAGEALGVGISIARLSGDQTARVDVRRGVWINAHKQPILNTLTVENTGEIALIATQSGAWGASAGAPGKATGAGEGGAYGASIALVNIEATTESVLREDSLLQGIGNDKGARILAQDTRLVSADARTHGAAGKTSFSGALSLMQRRDTVRALVSPRVRIALDGALTVKAENTGDTITVVSAAASGRTSIGVGIALTFADRTTVAGLVDAEMADETSFFSWSLGETEVAGLKVEAISTGNVISGGRTQAGEEPEAEEPGGSTPDPEQEEEDNTDAPVALDAAAIGDDSTRVADAIGGSNPLGGGGGGGDDDGGLAFAGDFGAIFSNVTTEALVIGRDSDAGSASGPINVKTTGEVTISSRTAINYGQSSAVTAAASGGVGIAGSFGLTWVEHDTATRLLDSKIVFGPNFADEKQDQKAVRITSADESRFDLLVDGRAGRADGGWSFAIAASFARFVTLTQTEIASSAILMGRAPEILGGGLNGWYYEDIEGGGWYNDESGDWRYDFDSGWQWDEDRGWFIAEWGGYVYSGDKQEDGSHLPPGYCEDGVCGPTGPEPRDISPDGRDIVITSLADPTLTIRATSQRTGPTGSSGGGGGDGPEQMDAVGDLTRDAGSKANEKGGDGLKGLSITVAPLRQIADASVLVRDSQIEAQLDGDGSDPQTPGKLVVESRARTNLDIDASSDNIAIGLAITDTFSRVQVDRTHLSVAKGGSVSIRSGADEKHKMVATAGAERAIKAAGILSLRSMDNRVLVGTRDDLFTQTQIRAGGQILVAADSDHDLDFRVIAADGTPSALALAGLISLSDTVTEAAVSGQYFSDDEIVVTAVNTYTRYRAVAIASAGSTVPGAEPSPPADPATPPDPAPDNTERDPSQGAVTNALLDVADETQDTVSDEEEEATGSGSEPEAAPAPRASRMTAFSIAFVVDLHKDNTSARVAATRVDDPLGAPIPSGPPNGASFNALTDTRPNVVVRAENRILSFQKEARAAIGAGDQAPDRGAVFAVTLGDWQLHADATMGQAVSTFARTVSVTARTVLPTVRAELNRADWLEDVGDLFADGAGGYASGDSRPKSADELVSGPDGSDEDHKTAGWNIITSTQTDFNKLGLAIDVSITRVRSSAHAKVLENGAPRVANTLNITAETTGGLASRRDPVGQEIGSGGSGAGGSGHVLLLHSDTLAQLGAQPQLGAPDFRSINTINVSAKTDMRAAVAASSFGQSESVALNIAFAMIDYDARTHARIVNPEQLIVQNTNVKAEDSSVLLVDAGSSAAGNISIGVSAGLIFGDRDVLAEIAGEGSTGTFNLGDITVEAELRGGALITTQAGAGQDEDEETPPPPTQDDEDDDDEEEGRDRTALPTALLGDRAETNAGDLADQRVQTDTQGAGGTADTSDDTQGDATQQSPVEGKSFGFALAGDFSGMFGRSHAVAQIDHGAGDLNAGSVTINAINNQALFAASGSAVGGAGSVGIGASVSLSNVERITRAMMAVRNGEVSGDHLRILAQDATQLRLFAAGRGGAAVNVNVMGSAAVEYGSQTVETELRADMLVVDLDKMLRDAAADGRPLDDDGDDANENPKGIIVRSRAAGSTLALAGAFKPVEGQPEGDGGGVSIGLAFAGSFARETVHARVEGDISAPEIRVFARRAGYIGALASSSGAADGFALAGAAAMAQIRREVRAEVVDSDITVSRAMEVIASDRADTRLRVGSDAESDTVSVGLAGAIALERRSVIAEILDSSITYIDGVDVTPLLVRARQEGNIDALQLGGGEELDPDSPPPEEDSDDEASGFSASIGLGIAYATRQTHARVIDSSIDMGDVTIEALQAGRIRNRQGVTESIGYGGSAGVILTRLQSDVVAEASNAGRGGAFPEIGGGLFAQGDLKIAALEETSLLSRSAKSGEGKVAIDIMVATTIVTGEVRAEASEIALGAQTIEITADDRTTLQSAALARSSTSKAGGIGGVGYAANRLDVIARAIDTAAFGYESLAVRARTESELTGTVVGMLESDGFAGALQSAWLTANRDVIAEVEWTSTLVGPGAVPDWAGNIEIEATRDDTLMGVSVTAAEASASVGIGANVLQTGGHTLAELRLAGLYHSLHGDVSVTARDSSKAMTVAIGAASGGGGFSAVGSLAYLQMGRRPADAVLTESDGRSEDHQAMIEGSRDSVSDDFAGQARLGSADLRRRFDLATEARVTVAQGTTMEVSGDLTIRAEDARQATAIAGQMQLNINTGDAASKAFDLVDISEDGVNIRIKSVAGDGMTGLSTFSLRGDGNDGSGVSAAGAEAGTTGGDGENSSGSVGVGLAFGWVRLGGMVAADLDVAQNGTVTVDGTLGLEALNTARAAGISIGAQVGGEINLGAGAGISRHDQFVRARISGGHRNLSRVTAVALDIQANSDGQSWAIAGLVTTGDGVAAGATLAVSNLDAVTEAVIDRASITTSSDMNLFSQDSSTSLTVALTGGVAIGGSAAIGASIGVNLAQSVTRTQVLGSNLDIGGDLGVGTYRAQVMNSYVLQIAVSSGAGIGAAFALSQQKGSSAAEIIGSNVATGGDVAVLAGGGGRIGAVAVSAAGGSDIAVSGSVSITISESKTRARIFNSQVEAGDTVLVDAAIFTQTGGLAGGDDRTYRSMQGVSGTGSIAIGGGFGVGVSVAVISLAAEVLAEIDSSTVTAYQGAGRDGIRATRIAPFMGLEYGLVFTGTRDGVGVFARNETWVRAMTVTAAGGGTAGIAMQVPVTIMRDDATARIARSRITSGSDVFVNSYNRTDLVTRSVVIGVGGSAGVGGLVEVGSFKKSTVADIYDSEVTAGGDVEVLAVSLELIEKVSFAGAGGGVAAVAGVVESLVSTNATYAGMRGVSVVASGDVSVDAISDRQISTRAGTLAVGGTAAVGGAVVVINARDETVAEITDGIGYFHPTVRFDRRDARPLDGNTSGLEEAIPIDREPGDDGFITPTLTSLDPVDPEDSLPGMPGVGLLAATVGMSFDSEIELRRGSAFGPLLPVTEATMRPEGASTVTAGSDITVRTLSDLRSTNFVVGAAGAGFAAVQGSVLVTKFEQVVLSRVGDWSILNAGLGAAGKFGGSDVRIIADQRFDQNMTVGAGAAGGLVGVAVSIGVTSANNTVLAAVGDRAEIEASRDVQIHASGVRDLDAKSAAVALAGVGGAGVALLSATFSASAWDQDSDRELRALGRDNERDPFTLHPDPDTDPYNDHGPQDLREDDAQLGSLLSEASADRESIDLNGIFSAARRDGILTSVGQRAQITAGRDLTVTAFEGGDIQMLAGAGAIAGLAGGAAGVTILKRGTNVQIDIRDNANLQAQAALRVGANVNTNDGNSQALSGAASLIVSLAGAVSVTSINRIMRVDLGEQVVMGAGSVSVFANERGVARATNVAGSVAVGLSVGATYATLTRESSVTVNLGGARIVGEEVSVEALRVGNLRAHSTAATGGIVASVSGSVATTEDRSSVLIDLRDAQIISAGLLDISVRNSGDIRSFAQGVAVSGAAAVGASLAIAERNAEALIESRAADLSARRIQITTLDAVGMDEDQAGLVVATTRVSVGAALGGALSASEARAVSSTRSEIDLSLTGAQALRSIVIDARSNSRAEADTRDTAIGTALAAGSTKAQVVTRNLTATSVDFVNGAIAADRIAVLATGRDHSVGAANSTKGSLVAALAAVTVEMDISPDTFVTVRGGLLDSLGEVEIRADRLSHFESTLDAREASLARKSRGELRTNASTDMRVRVESDILAPTIMIGADQALLRPNIGFNAMTKGGSAFALVSLVSRNRVITRNRIDVVGATFIQRAMPDGQGDGITLRLHDDIDVTDRLMQRNFGAITQFPGVDSQMDVSANVADIRLDGATLRGIGDVRLINRQDINVTNENLLHLSGRFSDSENVAITNVSSAPSVSLRHGSSILSQQGSVYLLAGRDVLENQRQTVSAESRTWTRNLRTPSYMLTAIAELSSRPAVLMDDTVNVTAGRDAVISAVQGITDVYAFFGKAGLYTSFDADEMNDLAAYVIENDISFAAEGGLATLVGSGRLLLEGTITAGAFSTQNIIINPDLTLTLSGETDEVEVEIEQDVAVNADLAAFILQRQLELARLDASNGPPDLRTRLVEEIASLQARLVRLGGADARGDLIALGNLFAAGGNVHLRADRIEGSGTLTARGDASIEVENRSAATMQIDGATIPFRSGGEIFVNATPVSNNAQIAQRAAAGGTPSLQLNTAPSSEVTPLLSLRGIHVAAGDAPRANLILTGSIENLSGRVEVTTLDGDILVLGANILGREVMINSGGDFFLSAEPGVVSLPRNPAGLYRDFFAQYENLNALDYEIYRAQVENRLAVAPSGIQFNPSSFEYPPFTVDTDARGFLRALGGVYIYADRLNIDGTIQSGETNWTLDISNFLEARLGQLTPDEIAGQTRILLYDPARLGAQIGRENPGLSPQPYITGSASVWYDLESNTLQVDPMLTRGGYIELVGRISSTGGLSPNGNAQLKVANGFGQISINNDTSLPLVLSAVDTGLGDLTGEIRIVDLNDVVRAGQALPGGGTIDPVYRTTLYRFRNGQVERSRTGFGELALQGEPAPIQEAGVIWTPFAAAQFQVQGNEALEFTNLRRVETETVIQQVRYERFLGQDYETREILSTDTYVTVLEEDLLSIATPVLSLFSDLSADRPYVYSRVTTPVSSDQSNFVLQERVADGFFLGIEGLPTRWRSTYESTQTVVVDVFDRHVLAANRPVDIAFTGANEGFVNITSRGDVRLDGLFHNPTGPTVITSTEGSILTTSPSAIMTTGSASFDAAGDIAGAGFEVPRQGVNISPMSYAKLGFFRAGSDTRVETGFMLLDQPAGATLHAVAGGDVQLRALSGDLRLNSVSGRNVQLHAPDSIRGAVGSAVVTAENLELVAARGSIGGPLDAAGNFLNIAVSGRVDAEAPGNIRLNAPNVFGGVIPVGLIESFAGDVVLRAASGGIIDVNPDQVDDRRARENLLAALWDELGLRSTTPEQDALRVEEAIADLVAAEADDYAFYWNTRLVRDPATGELQDRGFDPATEFSLTPQQIALRLSFGETMADINDALKDEQQRYLDAHARFGDEPFDPDRLEDRKTFRIDADRIAERTTELFMTDRQLMRGIREDLLLNVTDTVLVIEAPNIIASDADLFVTNGNIGRALGDIVIAPGQTLSEDVIAALWTAERDDLVFEPGGTVRVRLFDDVDVALSGSLRAEARDVLIGSEQDLRVEQVVAADMIRLKTAESLLNVATAPEQRILGQRIVLEAGQGSIGQAHDPLRVQQQGAAPVLDARAQAGIWIDAPQGNLWLGQIVSPQSISLGLPEGDLLGRDTVQNGHLRAPVIDILARGGSIGSTSGAHAPVIGTVPGSDIQLSLAAAQNYALGLAEGVVIALSGQTLPLDAPYAQSVRITGPGAVRLDDDLVLANGGDITLHVGELDLQGNSLITEAGAINLIVADGFKLEETSAIISRGGPVSVEALGDLTLLGVIEAGKGGTIDLIVAGNLDADGGRVSLITPEGLLRLVAMQVQASAREPLRTDLARLDATVRGGSLALENSETPLSLEGLHVKGASAQIVTLGQLTLAGSLIVGPTGEGVLMLLAGGGMDGSGAVTAGETYLYSLGGPIGTAVQALQLDVSRASGPFTIAALQGDVMLEITDGVFRADVVTAADGNVQLTSPEAVEIALVGSLTEPDFRVAAGSTIGPWGDLPFDMALVTGLGAELIAADMLTDASVPGPGAEEPGDGNDKPSDGEPGDDEGEPGDDKPGDDDGEPGDDKPGDDDGEPGDDDGEPGDDRPGDDDGEPGDDRPGDDDGEPGDDKPGDDEGEPGDDKPGDDKPGHDDGEPGDDRPGDDDGEPGDDKPGDDGGEPGDDRPGDDDGEPGDDRPGDDEGEPGDDRPGDDEGEPGDDKPGDDDGEPGDDRPGDDDGEPGDDRPGDDDGEPGDDDGEPWDDKPGGDDSEPGDDRPGEDDRGEQPSNRPSLLTQRNGDTRSRFESEMGQGMGPVRRAMGMDMPDKEDEDEDEEEARQ